MDKRKQKPNQVYSKKNKICKKESKTQGFPCPLWALRVPSPLAWAWTKRLLPVCSVYTVLACPGCYNKNAIHRVTRKQRKLICRLSGGWKIPDHGPGTCSVWGEPVLPLGPLSAEWERELEAPSMLIPFQRAPFFWCRLLPASPLPHTIPLGN